MSTPPSSTWDLSSSADLNANVALPSQTSSDDAARMIAAAMDNADSGADTPGGSPVLAQPDEPTYDDDLTHELRAMFPNGAPDLPETSGDISEAAPAQPEEPNFGAEEDYDIGAEMRASFPSGPQGLFDDRGRVIDDDEERQVLEHPESGTLPRRVPTPVPPSPAMPSLAPPSPAMPSMPMDPDLTDIDGAELARQRVRASPRPSRPTSATKRSSEASIERSSTPRRRTSEPESSPPTTTSWTQVMPSVEVGDVPASYGPVRSASPALPRTPSHSRPGSAHLGTGGEDQQEPYRSRSSGRRTPSSGAMPDTSADTTNAALRQGQEAGRSVVPTLQMQLEDAKKEIENTKMQSTSYLKAL